jgi:hypothetical protein
LQLFEITKAYILSYIFLIGDRIQKQEDYPSPEGAVWEAMTLGSANSNAASESEKVVGTNCYNCKFISDKEEALSPQELNDRGGIDPKDQGEMGRAMTADLITLPGWSKSDASSKKFCYNVKIKMCVTARMCCAYWDNEAVQRPWKMR